MRPPEEVSEPAQQPHARSIAIDGRSFFLGGFNTRIETAGLTAATFTVPDANDDTVPGRRADAATSAQRHR